MRHEIQNPERPMVHLWVDAILWEVPLEWLLRQVREGNEDAIDTDMILMWRNPAVTIQ